MSHTAPSIAIVGLGLIGASLARSLHAHQAPYLVTGWDVDAEARATCQREGWVRAAPAILAEAVTNADVVVLAVPVDQLANVTQQMAPHLKQGCIVTDVASVKQEAITAIAPHLPSHALLVPAHPIAGSAHAGHLHADATLFARKLLLLTPDDNVPDDAIIRVAEMWAYTGAHIERISAANHDVVYAYVSHLPQLMAYASTHTLARAHITSTPQPMDIFQLFTRIGASSPTLWRSIALANHTYLAMALATAIEILRHMAKELREAPQDATSSTVMDGKIAMLYSRVVSSALVAVIDAFEQQNEVQLAPYAGQGFRDFLAPAAYAAPDDDIEQIAACYAPVASLVEQTLVYLMAMQDALASHHGAQLEQLFTEAQLAYSQLFQHLAALPEAAE